MNFVDKTLLAFSDPAAAGALITQQSAKAVVGAAYGVPVASLSGAATTGFDRLDFAPFADTASTEITRRDYAIMRGSGPWPQSSGQQSRIDVLWNGSVTVSAAFERAEIGVASSGMPDLADIDGDIATPLPVDPTALDTARRAVVIARLKARANDPETVSDDTLDTWLAEAGLTSFSAFVEQAAAAMVPMNQFVLSFTPLPGTGIVAPLIFPVAAAVMIRDVAAADFRLADLMQATQQVLTRLEIEGVAPRSGGEALPTGRAATLWLVSDTWFEDGDWPGGDTGNAAARKAARITRATDWLAEQRIALVPVPG